jgi:hypothetical protein
MDEPVDHGGGYLYLWSSQGWTTWGELSWTPVHDMCAGPGAVRDGEEQVRLIRWRLLAEEPLAVVGAEQKSEAAQVGA